VLLHEPVTLVAVGRAATAGVLCSAIPMAADLRALRLVQARFYGVFMSVNPVFAALTGLIVLGQRLSLADWLSIAAIVTANAIALDGSGRPGADGSPDSRDSHGQDERAPVTCGGTSQPRLADLRRRPAPGRSCMTRRRWPGTPRARPSLLPGPSGPSERSV
jgi:multidrug transporter EmrE-like cation transporter